MICSIKKLFAILFCIVLLFTGCVNEDVVKVKVEIDCSDILSNYDLLDESLRDEKYVPEDGIILKEVEVKASAGDSALDVLKKVAREYNIHVDASAGYAKGINYIYEKSCGDASGWVYEVNDEAIMTDYTVAEGDLISWIYICDFLQMSFE